MDESAFMARHFALQRRRQKSEELWKAKQKDELPMTLIPDLGLLNSSSRATFGQQSTKRMSLGGAM